jgi:hypothetical protein
VPANSIAVKVSKTALNRYLQKDNPETVYIMTHGEFVAFHHSVPVGVQINVLLPLLNADYAGMNIYFTNAVEANEIRFVNRVKICDSFRIRIC